MMTAIVLFFVAPWALAVAVFVRGLTFGDVV
jgi:hypothetical protein